MAVWCTASKSNEIVIYPRRERSAIWLSTVVLLTGGEGLVQAAAEVVEAAATADEDNKTAFMDAGIGAAFTATLKTVPPAAVRATGRAVRRLTTADDSRPTVSRYKIPQTCTLQQFPNVHSKCQVYMHAYAEI